MTDEGEAGSIADRALNPWLLLAIWCLVVPLPAAMGLGLFVTHRSDYLGHYLAGYGATLFVAWLASRVAPARPGVVVLATLVCVALGVVTEATVFRIATFDRLDFFAQSAGAVLAGLAVLNTRTADGESFVDRGTEGALFACVSGVYLMLGFVYAFA